MRHYEIGFIVHPDQSEQVPGMVERYRAIVTTKAVDPSSGRLEAAASWLYPIQKIQPRPHYVLMNIECDGETLNELEHSFVQRRRACAI